MKPVFTILILINAAGFLFMLVDKQKAKQHRRRIPEAFLLGIAFLGGSLGCILGMLLCRHKLRKPRFSFGLYIMLIGHMFLIPWLLSLKP